MPHALSTSKTLGKDPVWKCYGAPHALERHAQTLTECEILLLLTVAATQTLARCQ